MWKYLVQLTAQKLTQLRKLKSIVKITSIGTDYEILCKGNYLKNCQNLQIISSWKNYDPIFTIRKKALKFADRVLNDKIDEFIFEPCPLQGIEYLKAMLGGVI